MSSEENSGSMQDTGTVPAESPVSIAPASGEVGSLLASIDTLAPVVAGEIVQGRVLKVTDTEVIVDLGLKSEATLPLTEFSANGGQVPVQPGETLDLLVEHCDEVTGTISVSRRKAAQSKTWDEIERAFNEQTNVRGRVLDRTKGGLIVDIGIPAFLPGSLADARLRCNLDALRGQEIECKVIKVNKKRNNAVVSRKLVLEEELERQRARLRERLVEGAVLTGRVKNLTDYGVFVDLGGMDGLVHVTDLSWGRIGHPSEVVEVGSEIQVKVLKVDLEKNRVSLGVKQITPDPWERVESMHHAGDRLAGRVLSITDYGAFVELEPGVEGLIHISEMTWGKRLKHPSKILTVGDRVEVVLVDVNRDQRRISLSLRRALPDPWTTLAERLPVNSLVEGRVRNLTDFGAFVEIEDGVDGLIHLSNLSWGRQVKSPSEVLKKGQKVQAIVLNVDPTKRRLSLGLKQLQSDSWDEFFAKTQVGDSVRGKVSRRVAFGAFVELAAGIEGLCHMSEFPETEPGRGPAQPEVGSEFDFRVIRLSPEERKIGLSLRSSRPEGAGAI